MDLHDSAGARLGKIEDLVFDAKGRVSHVVVQADVAGQPRLVPVPWSTITFPMASQPGMESVSDKLTTNFSSTRLQTAPHFDSTQWPKEGQDTVFTEADTFFGTGAAKDGGIVPKTPTDASAPRSTWFRASRMRNMNVTDGAGQPLGSLGQFVIDSNTGRIAYATMTVNPGGDSPRVIAVPWDTFQASRMNDRDQLKISFPMDRLHQAPEFQAGTPGWQQMSDPKWVSSLYSYYSVRPYWNEGSSTKPTTPKSTTPPPEKKPSRP
jgi:sporulation protein YlmC with PRC-barrel domain